MPFGSAFFALFRYFYYRFGGEGVGDSMSHPLEKFMFLSIKILKCNKIKDIRDIQTQISTRF